MEDTRHPLRAICRGCWWQKKLKVGLFYSIVNGWAPANFHPTSYVKFLLVGISDLMSHVYGANPTRGVMCLFHFNAHRISHSHGVVTWQCVRMHSSQTKMKGKFWNIPSINIKIVCNQTLIKLLLPSSWKLYCKVWWSKPGRNIHWMVSSIIIPHSS